MSEQAYGIVYDEGDGNREVDETVALHQQRLNALGDALSKSRAEAIEDRRTSGIERIWLEDEEHYEGIDDANRAEYGYDSKPPLQGQLADEDGEHVGSTIFFNITRPYVDAAAAKVSEIVQPTDDTAWSIRPTPIPDLITIANGKLPPEISRQIENDPRLAGNEEAISKTKNDLETEIKEQLEQAARKAEKATRRIEDWHSQCDFQGEVRKVIEDAAKIGSGVLKGPVSTIRKTVVWTYGEGLRIVDTLGPASYRIDPWNFFPAKGCGENIHSGDHCWERDDISKAKLLALRDAPGYIADAIDFVVSQGPTKATRISEGEDPGFANLKKRNTDDLYEIWYMHGLIDPDDMIAAGCECEATDLVPAQITMVNNTVIKAIRNISDSGDLPYDVLNWQRRSGSPFGTGVARQIREPQRVVNGGGRNMMDNAGLAGGPMWAFKFGTLSPIDGVYEIAPRKGWVAGEDADLERIEDAIKFIEFPMMQRELQGIIEMGLKLAEDVTGLPMILQGQKGQAPDTVGGMQLLSGNASSVLRRIARIFDDFLIEPHIRRYYRYLLQYGPDDEKGDLLIEARASTALVEKDIQNESMGEIADVVADPKFGIDPRKWAEEFLKGKKIDVRKIKFTDEEWRGVVEKLAQPQPDSKVEVAEIKAKTELALGELRQAIKQMELQSKDTIDARRLQAEMMFKEMDVWVAQLKEEGKKEVSLDRIKEQMSSLVIKLKAQAEMQRSGGGPEMLPAPTEPPGIAPEGQAFVR